MTSPVQSLEDAFQYNSSLARAQLPSFPIPQRAVVLQWLGKLSDEGNALVGGKRVSALRTRNDYMWFLLLVLRGGRITEPFRSPPPPGSLPPLHDVLSDTVYEDVLSAAGGEDEWQEKLAAGTLAMSSMSVGGQNTLQPEPPEPRDFLSTLPVPRRGGVRIYMAAFSAQDP